MFFYICNVLCLASLRKVASLPLDFSLCLTPCLLPDFFLNRKYPDFALSSTLLPSTSGKLSFQRKNNGKTIYPYFLKWSILVQKITEFHMSKEKTLVVVTYKHTFIVYLLCVRNVWAHGDIQIRYCYQKGCALLGQARLKCRKRQIIFQKRHWHQSHYYKRWGRGEDWWVGSR